MNDPLAGRPLTPPSPHRMGRVVVPPGRDRVRGFRGTMRVFIRGSLSANKVGERVGERWNLLSGAPLPARLTRGERDRFITSENGLLPEGSHGIEPFVVNPGSGFAGGD